MTGRKGGYLEEVVRAYFAKQGFFALRSVSLRYESNEVTDVDIWLYARQSAGIRTRVVVDVKNKKSPHALERVLWTKGLQMITGADRAVVVTTDTEARIAKFGYEQKVVVLTKLFLERLQKTLPLDERLTREEFLNAIRLYSAQKADGDWIRRLEDAKSGLISLPGFPAFNTAINSFAFFAERVETRPQHREQAFRCVLLCAAIGSIALDAALERVVFEERPARYGAIIGGVRYGDSGDGRIQKSIRDVLDLVRESMEDGRVIAQQAREQIDKQFSAVRADILAEYFSPEHNSSHLVAIGRELEAAAHQRSAPQPELLSSESRAFLGVLADFTRVRRTTIIGSGGGSILNTGAAHISGLKINDGSNELPTLQQKIDL